MSKGALPQGINDVVEAPVGLCSGGRHSAAPINAAGAWQVGEVQVLRLILDGITARDYLSWVGDPEPHALGQELRSISVSADPLDNQYRPRAPLGSRPA